MNTRTIIKGVSFDISFIIIQDLNLKKVRSGKKCAGGTFLATKCEVGTVSERNGHRARKICEAKLCPVTSTKEKTALESHFRAF